MARGRRLCPCIHTSSPSPACGAGSYPTGPRTIRAPPLALDSPSEPNEAILGGEAAELLLRRPPCLRLRLPAVRKERQPHRLVLQPEKPAGVPGVAEELWGEGSQGRGGRRHNLRSAPHRRGGRVKRTGRRRPRGLRTLRILPWVPDGASVGACALWGGMQTGMCQGEGARPQNLFLPLRLPPLRLLHFRPEVRRAPLPRCPYSTLPKPKRPAPGGSLRRCEFPPRRYKQSHSRRHRRLCHQRTGQNSHCQYNYESPSAQRRWLLLSRRACRFCPR
mmetsp:Transcript_5618/g.11149  ORF Transcript_5618/g.11149 Transcript_5618/m.11149 type:complete len:276 (+) Transcript_5618:339-1166(+)